MAALDRIRVYPVKGLDGVDVAASEIRPGGTLAFDREFALFDTDGEVFNGKRTSRVHELRTEFDPETSELTVETPAGDRERFDLVDEPARAERWFSDAFDEELTLERDDSLGYVDRRDRGPSVISTATIETVASWFDELTSESVRRRLRANLEVSGVPAFWEDRFVGEGAPALRIGDAELVDSTPCARCVVPERDPDTGERLAAFREQFVEKRRETFPDWADADAFDHYYATMVITSVPEESRGATLAVGGAVEAVER